MNLRAIVIFLVLILASLLCSACICGMDKKTDTVAAERISVAEAETLVTEWMFTTNPDMNPSAQFPLEETTTDEIWGRLGIQLFRLHSDFLGPSTFVITSNEVHVLGTSFGGYGVTHMMVTDLNLDGDPELTYTYSWGSGIHRSHIAVYLPEQTSPKSIDGNLVFYHGDLILRKYGDHDVVVEAGYYNWQRDVFVSQTPLGTVSLEAIDGEWEVIVSLYDDLPFDLTDRLSFP